MRPTWPQRIEETLGRLAESGIRAYVVGGAVRDRILGRETRDFDLLLDASLDAARQVLPEAAAVEAQTPVLLLRGEEHEPRIEITAMGAGTENLEQNLVLRDFTMNAMAFDLVEQAVRDPFDGQRHLRDRLVVAVDSTRSFRDDPVRILRGVRLAEELEFAIEPETERAMARDAWRLGGAAGERLRDELFRLLALPRASGGLERLRAVGALGVVLPELIRTVGVAQNRHHPDDVYRHTLRVTDAVPADPVLRLAALLHDAAKPETKRFVQRKNDFSFLRHELVCARHIRRVASRLRLSRREETTVARLVRHHLVFPSRLATDRAIRRMLHRVGDDILPALLQLRRADLASRSPSGVALPGWEELLQRIERVQAQQREQGGGVLAISGRDVMQVLGIEEGPEVGRWLRRATQRVLDRPEENDRERLLAWVQRSAGAEEHRCTRT